MFIRLLNYKQVSGCHYLNLQSIESRKIKARAKRNRLQKKARRITRLNKK